MVEVAGSHLTLNSDIETHEGVKMVNWRENGWWEYMNAKGNYTEEKFDLRYSNRFPLIIRRGRVQR